MQQIRSDLTRNWPLVQRILSTSTTVYSGITGAAGTLTIQAELIDLIASAGPDGERLFWDHLCCPDPVISAYCLDGLLNVRSHHLDHLPNELFQRTELVCFFNGPFSMTVTLGEYARLTYNHWLELIN